MVTRVRAQGSRERDVAARSALGGVPPAAPEACASSSGSRCGSRPQRSSRLADAGWGWGAHAALPGDYGKNQNSS
jgi:hypothetical protein